MGVAIFSYNNLVTVGVVTDAGLVPDPETIAVEFDREFARLLAEVQAAAADTLAAQAGAAQAEPTHCAATTAAGTPCKNRALAGSAYCRVHQAKAASRLEELTPLKTQSTRRRTD